MYKLVIFDLDGTLADSVPDLTTALGLLLDSFNLARLDEATVRAIVGEGQRSLVERALRRAGHPEAQGDVVQAHLLDNAVRLFRGHYTANLCVKTRLYDGVSDTLAQLSEQTTLAVATNKPGRWARALCETLGISPLFRWILGEDDVGARKPDPRLLYELCDRAQVPNAQSLFVGDSRIDWLAAEAAGTDLALCTYGYADEATIDKAMALAESQELSCRVGSPQRPFLCRRFSDLLDITRRQNA